MGRFPELWVAFGIAGTVFGWAEVVQYLMG